MAKPLPDALPDVVDRRGAVDAAAARAGGSLISLALAFEHQRADRRSRRRQAACTAGVWAAPPAIAAGAAASSAAGSGSDSGACGVQGAGAEQQRSEREARQGFTRLPDIDLLPDLQELAQLVASFSGTATLTR